MPNSLILKFDTTVGASTLSRTGKPWKKLRRRFFDDELVEIERKIHAGEDGTIWRIYYKALIMARGSDGDKVQFRRRTGMFHYIPADPTRAETARAEFDEYVGDETTVGSWHKLFRLLGIDPEAFPTSVRKCKMLLRSLRIYINIFDFVDAMRMNKKACHFRTFWALKQYSISNNKIFPLYEAREDSALRLLLQPILRRN